MNDLSFFDQMQGWKYSNKWNTLWNVQLWMEQSSNGTFFAEHFCNYLDCFCASSILFTFVGSCHIARFSTLLLHFLPSSQVSRFSTSRFPHAEVHRLMSKGQEAVLTQKAAWKSSLETVNTIFATLEFSPFCAGDIEHCGLGLFSTAFLGCRDPWEEGAGKRKICEKTPVRCAKDLGILDIVLISLSSWFKVLE